MRSYDDISCLQCGAGYTEEGKLVSNRSAQRFEAPVALPENMLSETNQPSKGQRRGGANTPSLCRAFKETAEMIFDFIYAIFLWIVLH